MKVVLLSTYDLGHQPFGLASPAAWLAEAGAQVTCNDLAVEDLDEGAVGGAGLICIYLPMHTATRLAGAVVPRLRALNPKAHLCFYGLYAPLNEDCLRGLGATTILGGEFEAPMARLYVRLAANGAAAPTAPANGAWAEPTVSHAKQRFRVPARHGLPALSSYAHLVAEDGERRTAGYTEASRGCKYRCRHCPVVPVYDGRFRIVQADVVMEDIRRQVAAGARHITFGDPDFFNGVGHAIAVVEALAAEMPGTTYDATIKVEHLLGHVTHLGTLARTGCLFVTTAVESVDDGVLHILDKGHTRNDFAHVTGLARAAGLTLSPTFIPFTPWMSLEGYVDLLALIAELGLVDNVAPVQLAMRLLVPQGSRLLELDETRHHLGAFDGRALAYPWTHPDARLDALHETINRIVEVGEAGGDGRRAVFARLWEAAHEAGGRPAPPLPDAGTPVAETRVPRLSEPWYCCAEPTAEQLAGV